MAETHAAPLEKAVAEARKALADYDGCKGYEADEYAMCCIEPFRLLLAAIDADKPACESGVICPTCVHLEEAEAALRFYANREIYEETTTTHGLVPACGPEIVIEDGGERARRYFAERGER